MSDDNTKTNEGGNNVDVKTLTDKVSSLTSQLEKANAKIEGYETKISDLSTKEESFTTANTQLNEQMSTLKAELETATTSLKSKDGELTNLQTQIDQINGQFGETTAKLGEAEKTLQLYNTIKETPEYHSLIGMIDGIKIVDDAEAQKTILDGFASGMKQQADNLIGQFRSGGTPASGTGGQPAQTGPKNVKEAFSRLQQINGLPGHQAEASSLNQFIMEAQNGNSGGPA